MQIEYRYELNDCIDIDNFYKYVNLNRFNKNSLNINNISVAIFSVTNRDRSLNQNTLRKVCYRFMLDTLSQTSFFQNYSIYILYSDDHWVPTSRINSYLKLWKRQAYQCFQNIEPKIDIEIKQEHLSRYAGIVKLPITYHKIYFSHTIPIGRLIFSQNSLCDQMTIETYDSLLHQKYHNEYYEQLLSDNRIVMSANYEEDFCGLFNVTLLLNNDNAQYFRL